MRIGDGNIRVRPPPPPPLPPLSTGSGQEGTPRFLGLFEGGHGDGDAGGLEGHPRSGPLEHSRQTPRTVAPPQGVQHAGVRRGGCRGRDGRWRRRGRSSLHLMSVRGGWGRPQAARCCACGAMRYKLAMPVLNTM